MRGAPVPLDRTLERLALLAAIRGDVAERELLTIATDLIRQQGIASDADLESLVESPPAGADPDVIRRLHQMYDAGAWVLMESAIADLPSDLRWLYESDAISIEQLAVLHDRFPAASVADLSLATDLGAVRTLPGLNEAVERAIAGALPTLRASTPRIPLGRATAMIEPWLDDLRRTPGIGWAMPAGSLRRGQETVGDIEIVAAASDPTAAITDLVHRPELTRCLHRSARRLCLLLERVQVSVRFPEPDAAPSTLLLLTGSRAHTAAVRLRADQIGLRLTHEGLFFADGSPRPVASEEDIYSALGMQFVPPEIRNGEDEIQAALEGSIPELVAERDIRGDFHMHTVWSDGRDTTGAMVAACSALGYEYMAITDHSPHSGALRNLTNDAVTRQAEEIAQLRERFPAMSILHGCEVDIRPDGKLDFSDRILEKFDIVLASLHDGAGQPPEHLLRRYVAAMKHPLVAIVTHPTNRLVPYRQGYDLDYDRLFEAAVNTGTILEIDGAPSHLDLDGALARRALRAGATFSIDSDCHRAELLKRHMQFGIATARRGWVEARHVLNARPLADVQAFMARKRAR